VSKVDEDQTDLSLDETAAFAEYEAGNLDVQHTASGDMDRVLTDPVYSQEIQMLMTWASSSTPSTHPAAHR
jgi:hypothetical protein